MHQEAQFEVGPEYSVAQLNIAEQIFELNPTGHWGLPLPISIPLSPENPRQYGGAIYRFRPKIRAAR